MCFRKQYQFCTDILQGNLWYVISSSLQKTIKKMGFETNFLLSHTQNTCERLLEREM